MPRRQLLKKNNNNNQFCLVSPNTETLPITGNSTSKATTFPTGNSCCTSHSKRRKGKRFHLQVFVATPLVCRFLTPGSESQFHFVAFGFLYLNLRH